MRIMPLNQVANLANGSPIEALEVKISRVWEFNQNENDKGPFSYQNIGVTDISGKVKATLRFKNCDEVTDSWKGRTLQITSSLDEKNHARGIHTEEYNGKQQIIVNNYAEIAFTSGAPAKQAPPARQQSQPQQGTRPATQQQPAPASANRPVFGSTVGMAVKEANTVLLALHGANPAYFFTRSYARDIHALASQYIRVAEMLEARRLAPKPNDDTPPVPQPTRPPAPAPAQRAQAETRQSQPARQPVRREPEPEPKPEYAPPQTDDDGGWGGGGDDFGEGPIQDGMEGDDIPF